MLSASTRLRILTETITSPTLAAQLQALLRKFPAAKWHQYQPVNRDHAHEGARMAFGARDPSRYAKLETGVKPAL